MDQGKNHRLVEDRINEIAVGLMRGPYVRRQYFPPQSILTDLNRPEIEDFNTTVSDAPIQWMWLSLNNRLLPVTEAVGATCSTTFLYPRPSCSARAVTWTIADYIRCSAVQHSTERGG